MLPLNADRVDSERPAPTKAAAKPVRWKMANRKIRRSYARCMADYSMANRLSKRRYESEHYRRWTHRMDSTRPVPRPLAVKQVVDDETLDLERPDRFDPR